MAAARSPIACGRSSRDSTPPRDAAQIQRQLTMLHALAERCGNSVSLRSASSLRVNASGGVGCQMGTMVVIHSLIVPDVRSSPSSCSSRARKLPTERHHTASTTSATGSPDRAGPRMSWIRVLVTPRGGNRRQERGGRAAQPQYAPLSTTPPRHRG